MSSLDSDKWKESIKEELESINKNNAWELVDFPRIKNYML